LTSILSELEDFDFDGQMDRALYQMASSKFLAVDTESTGLLIKDGTDTLIGISVAGRDMFNDMEMFSYYFPIQHERNNISDANRERLFESLLSRNKDAPVIYHNAKFDLFSMLTVGLDMRGVYFYDTMMMAHLVNENWWSKTLDWLSKNVCKNEGKRQSELWLACKALYGWSAKFPASVMGDYATGDTERTLELFEKLWPKFQSEGYVG
jgi:DNA polymerase I-like protein with 3'-5' exonuclease and polymerase domains